MYIQIDLSSVRLIPVIEMLVRGPHTDGCGVESVLWLVLNLGLIGISNPHILPAANGQSG